MLKNTGLIILIVFYIGAGINHFIHPAGYLSIIPAYLPYPAVINIMAGIAEIVWGIALIFRPLRRTAAIGIVLMLIAFIPSHIYMIQKGGCMGPKPALCIPLWLAWVRLLMLQPLLIWWVWSVRGVNFKQADVGKKATDSTL